MAEKILCVDDELNILLALQRQLRKQFHVECAMGAEQALATMERRPLCGDRVGPANAWDERA